MELGNIWSNTVGQGALFWVATGSVALGITLILAAGIAQVRIMRAARAAACFSGFQGDPAEAQIPSNQLSVPPGADSGREDQPVPAETPEAAEIPDSRELRALLTRLRQSADQLDTFRRQTPAAPALPSDSRLKDDPPAVEYVFRAGIG